MPQFEVAEEVAKSVLMSRYNQPYSEIERIPYTDKLFFLRLSEAEDQYNKTEMDKTKKDMDKLRSRMRRR